MHIVSVVIHQEQPIKKNLSFKQSDVVRVLSGTFRYVERLESAWG